MYPYKLLLFLHLLIWGTIHSVAQPIVVEKDNRWGAMDRDGNIIIPCKYRELKCFAEGLAVSRTEGVYGYIDSLGKQVIPEKYDYASPFQHGKAIVRVSNHNYIIDKKGNILLKFNGTDARFTKNCIIYQKEKTKYHKQKVLSIDGKPLLSKNEFFINDPEPNYPFFITVKAGYYYLKSESGKTVAQLGKYAYSNIVVKNTLFSTGICTYRNGQIISVQGADTIRVLDKSGHLINTIVAPKGYFFDNRYDMTICNDYYLAVESAINRQDWKVNIYDTTGHLKVSFTPKKVEYHFISKDVIVQGKKGDFQVKNENGGILIERIIDFSFERYKGATNPKMLVILPDSSYKLIDTKGNIEKLPNGYRFIEYDNTLAQVVFIETINGKTRKRLYAPQTNQIMDPVGSLPHPCCSDIQILYTPSDKFYVNTDGQELFRSKNHPEENDALYPSPYSFVSYPILDIIQDTSNLEKGSIRAKFRVTKIPSRDTSNNRRLSHQVYFRNSTKTPLDLRKLEYVYMQVQNKYGQWVDFNRYHFVPWLYENKTVIKSSQGIHFPIYALFGRYKTKMRLMVFTPSLKKKKRRIYSNTFRVSINPDFFLPKFSQNKYTH